MKTSNKILLLTVIVILSLTTIVIVCMGMLISGSSFPLQKIDKGQNQIVSRDFTLKDFSSVRSGGSWEIEIVRGDSFTVTVTGPAYIMDYVHPEIFGGALRIEQSFSADPRNVSLKARVSMPELTVIESAGNSKICFSGFNIARLAINASNASHVTGDTASIESLVCTVSGTAQVNLESCPVVNADFDISWSGNVSLHMAGGRLKGKASATTMIVYSGDVKELDIDASGTVKIRKIVRP